MKADTKVRPLTIEDSKTNHAWDIFTSMSPLEKYSMSQKFQDVANINKRQTAIVNYIEDNIEEFI